MGNTELKRGESETVVSQYPGTLMGNAKLEKGEFYFSFGITIFRFFAKKFLP